MTVKLLTEHHLKFLSLKVGCIGLSESTLVKISNCWKSHAWLIFCCASIFQNAVSMLKQEYKDGDINLENALQLSIKVLSKTLDMTKVTSEKGRSESRPRGLFVFSCST